MITITAYKIVFNGTSRVIEEEYTVDDALGLELLRASLKAKYKAAAILFMPTKIISNLEPDLTAYL